MSVDGNGLNGASCYPSSGDRDCESFTPQRDISRFAWTYDDTNVYTYLDRPNSNATLTYSFIMDVNVNGIAETTDRVLQATWKTGSRTVEVKLFAYVPFATAGDSLTCPNAGVCPSASNPHGEVGFADGYTMLGSTGTQLWTPPAPVPACSGSGAGDECGGDGIGTRFEVLVPWAQLGVPARSPIFWHVAASTNTNFSQAKDNVGGPDGRVGAFGVYGVDFTADLNGSMRSPGSYDYCHTVTNTGQFTDSYNLSAISSLGASVTFLADVGGCVAGATLTDTNGDLLPDTGLLAGGVSRSIIVRLSVASGLNGSNDRLVATARSTGRGTLVFDSVTDRTRIGLVTVQPDFNVSGTPGLVVDIGPHVVQNNQGASDTFTYGVTSERGYSVSLYSNVANAPGALLATDTNGDGVWDSTPPTVVLAADGGTVSNWLRVTIPPAAPIGTVDSVTLSATSNTAPVVTSTATDTLRVLSGLTLVNSYTAPNSQLIGPAATT